MPTWPKEHGGRWRWTRRWSEPISTQLERGACQRCRPTQGALSNYTIPGADQDPEALGRSRGGVTTKIHLIADSRCSAVGPPAHGGPTSRFPRVQADAGDADRAPHRSGTTPDPPGRSLGGQGVFHRAIRAYLRGRGIRATIPEPADQQAGRARRGRRGGRPPTFDAEHYKQRNTAERCVNKLKAHRAVATRYDKREYMYQGTVDVASIRIWLKDPVQ